ncbi:MAG TPA: LCP family protein [Solirubrobacterales bacterium]|jgi:LCP family protein required for cell wall assembly|nr:LCP family protein [Solirubrobacterales bacterium]HMU25771.1 LCP family protein [Solirubrobacterales bacterium]HMX70684.1 LCP family protein [Solirubrobacterales bacterium]HMY26092.1 LCP family protein [Solirubrobacterales bacterium]HNA23529.1 LCP family protein [Solirubrobacterales bacterium]
MTEEQSEPEEREEPPAEEPVVEEPPAEEPVAGTPEPDPGEYADPPTEELFAFEARVEEGEVPDLDPVFRAALLESSESALGEQPPSSEPPAGTGESAAAPEADQQPTTGEEQNTGEQPLTGEEPYTGEEPVTGTSEFEPPTDTGITAEQTAVLQATARSEVHDAIEYSRRTGNAWDPPRPPTGGDFDKPAKRPRYWWRFLLATLLIVFSFATATQASVMYFVNSIVEDLHKPNQKPLPPGILNADDGPQTIAIIGSDVRTGGGAASGDPGRSDTTLLVRLDPDTNQIAMLSIPRDLYVDIPGYGYDKFNAAFSYGGTELTLKTLKSITGLDINHYINVDFQGFADVIDAIHCVYVDVDRHYFNDNSQGGEEYATIDIEAGYQKLCGSDALDFARYRHTDSDLVRAARQQDLMGEVRNRLSFGELLSQRDELLKAFVDNTTTDIGETGDSKDVFSLLKLLLDSRGAAVTEVTFPSTFTMRDGVSYVEATPDEIQAAVDKFLGFEDQPGPVGTLDQGDGANNPARKEAQQKQQKKAARERQKALDESTTHVPSKDEDQLVDASSSGLSVAQELDSEITRTDFPVYYPKRLPSGALYADGESRVYHTRDPDKNVYGAYRMVMEVQLDDGLHYFGLQGLRGWTDPPILDAPHDEVEMDDRTFQVYPEGDRIKLIAWTDGDNVYWISNSLLLGLDNEQMLGMARSTRAFTPDK